MMYPPIRKARHSSWSIVYVDALPNARPGFDGSFQIKQDSPINYIPFAGVDREATAKAREFLAPTPILSFHRTLKTGKSYTWLSGIQIEAVVPIS